MSQFVLDASAVLALLGREKGWEEVEQAITVGSAISTVNVAEVVDGAKPESTRTRMNGRPAVLLSVAKQPKSNEISTVDGVRAVLEAMSGSLPEGVAIDALADDSEFTRSSQASVQRTLFEAVLLTGLVLLVFLHLGDQQVLRLPDGFCVDVANGLVGQLRVLLGPDALVS